MLKNIFPISILFVYLIACTEFAQLLRVPLLVSHFVEHKQENKSISFGEFLLIHYVAEYGSDGDYEQDTNLPFKTVDGSAVQIVAFVSFLNQCLKVKPIYTKSGKYNPYEECFIDNAYLSSIWQPPKKAFSNQLSTFINQLI